MQQKQSANEQENQEVKQPVKVLTSSHNANLDYDAIKKVAIDQSPLVTSYPLSAFELGRNKTIKIDGKIMPITEQAYNHFLKKVLRVDPQFVKRFKTVTDEKTEIAMLGALKAGMSIKKAEKVHILANPNSRLITSFTSGKNTFRTNEALLTIFESIMNAHSSLELRDFYMMEDGNMCISARSSTEAVRNIKSEVFQGGLTLKNSYETGSGIFHNAFRMICENGMFGFSDLPLFVGSSEKAMLGFFDKLKVLDNNAWVENNFWDKLEMATQINASVAELITAKNSMLMNSELTEQNLESFLPGYKSTQRWLTGKKVNMENLTQPQMKNCLSRVNLWDLINQMTDFGSHDYGYNTDFGRVQSSAGRLLSKGYDALDLVLFED